MQKKAKRAGRWRAGLDKAARREQRREEKRAAGRKFKDGYRLAVVSLRGAV
jgi:hypothetical protein